MKVYITNKKEFESVVKNSKSIHILLYNLVSKNIDVDDIYKKNVSIGNYDFELKALKENIVFYEFTGRN